MKLIIVESPHKATTIQNYLGKTDYKVEASKGHVRDLPTKTLGIDIEHDFTPQYVITPEKQKTIDNLVKEVKSKKYDEVYLATDPDREGEAISWHLKECLGLKKDKIRIEFNEISKSAVLKAMESPREIDDNLVNSQQARRVLDRLVGYKISPILSRRIKAGSSAGRVQSAALKMIVERENEIRNFKPEEYWNMAAMLYKEGDKHTKSNLIKANLQEVNKKKIKVNSGEMAEEIASLMQNATYYVDTVKKGVSISKPAPPFTTSTLQQEANHKLGMASDKAMRIAQQLYEGVNISGEGQHALVTYIRTDSVRISPEFAQKTLYYIKNKYGAEFAPARPNVYKTSEKAQDAHEAIRPISLDRTPDSLKDKVDKDAYRLYKLIYERFLASQMKNAEFYTMNVHITGDTADKSLGFVVKGKSVKFKGFTAVYTATSDKEEDKDELGTMPDLKEGDKFEFESVFKEQKFTTPPARYNDATLIKALEENGIGRPSTYASIISVIAKREYTEKQGKFLAPTQLGETVCGYMQDFFPTVMDLSFTARLETKLDKVAEGEEDWHNLVKVYYNHLAKYIDYAARTGGPNLLPPVESDVVCEKCGAKMVIKDGKHGKFLACPNFPKCKNIKNMHEQVGVCPKCGGAVEKRVGKNGKSFYGCANYPSCDFISKTKPAPHLCPKCNSPMKISKGKYETLYVCTNEDCKHVESEE
ncbi:MAG: type I DNA topoisomerase [Clostridia bacterium]|nr:type I DNA topoisomerase [Clostridia bacterium]